MYKEIAIIAPTASGKTALSISLAHKLNAIILSLDSLAIYKHIDITSAKPTLNERDNIKHFGIDIIYPNQSFDVIEYIKIYKQAKLYAQKHNKNLIIVGGSGFYLKTLLQGISNIPKISKSTKQWVKHQLTNIDKAYKFLYEKDKAYMEKIALNDRYRIEKALSIYKQTNSVASVYFEQNKPKPIIDNTDIYEIETDPAVLRDNIALRTQNMLDLGLIDEVIYLEKKYTREPNSMQSIGIKETLDYLDGKLSKEQLKEKIIINTVRLAKHQRTFNKGQFCNTLKYPLEQMENIICSNISTI